MLEQIPVLVSTLKKKKLLFLAHPFLYLATALSLEGLILTLKRRYFAHLMQRTDLFEKTLMLGKIEGRRRRG